MLYYKVIRRKGSISFTIIAKIKRIINNKSTQISESFIEIASTSDRQTLVAYNNLRTA